MWRGFRLNLTDEGQSSSSPASWQGPRLLLLEKVLKNCCQPWWTTCPLRTSPHKLQPFKTESFCFHHGSSIFFHIYWQSSWECHLNKYLMLFLNHAWSLASVISCGSECLHRQHVGKHLLPAELDSSLWRRTSSSKLCSLAAHHPVAAEQRWPPTVCDKPKATWTSLACEDEEVRWVPQHLTACHTSIMGAGHTEMATAAGTWQLLKPPYCSRTLGSDHAWSHGRAGLCPCTTRELLLLPFPGGDPHHTAERVFGQLGSCCVLLPLQVSSGSIYAHLPSPALMGSGLKGRHLQLLNEEPPDQKHDRHLAALKQAPAKTSRVRNQFPK